MYAARHENSHGTKNDNVRDCGFTKMVLDQTKVRENKQNTRTTEDEGGKREVFLSQLQLFPREEAGNTI